MLSVSTLKIPEITLIFLLLSLQVLYDSLEKTVAREFAVSHGNRSDRKGGKERM